MKVSMNRYKRSLTQAHHAPTQISELGHSGAGPSMYFIEDTEPKRPNIISRGRQRNSSPPQSSSFVVNQNNVNNLLTISGQHQQQNLQNQQVNYQVSQQQQVQGQTVQHQMQNDVQESVANQETFNLVSTNPGTSQNQSGEMILSPNTGTVTISSSEGENMQLDSIPFHLLSDENTQTFLNSGQFETIETEDGNVLLILKEDIENPGVGTHSTIPNAVSLNSELPPLHVTPNYLIDHDVTTCTPSIESPISSVEVNSSVVQQHQQQIEQQQHQQHQLDSSSLIQLTQQQLDTIDLSEQLVVNTSDSNGIEPQSYFLLQMSDGTSYLVPTDSVDGAEVVQSGVPTETIVPDIIPTVAAPVTAVPPKAKPRTQKPRTKPTPIPKSATSNAPKSMPFKVQLQSQPPPLVPVKRRAVTPAPEQPEHQKPYRFIMSDEGEDRREISLPMNPFVVKVLAQPPVTSPARQPSQPKEMGTCTSGTGPPQLILKMPAKVATNLPQSVSSTLAQSLQGASKPSNVAVVEGMLELADGHFKCSMCAKITKLKVNMVNHINRCHKAEKQFFCPDCGEAFQYASTLRAHHESAHVIKIFKCVPCTINFSTETELKSHFSSVHASQKNVVVVSTSSTANNSCSVYPAANSEKFSCGQCKKAFASKNTLMRHKIDHWDMKRGNITCDECSKAFPSKVNYLNHMQAHRDDLLAHSCETCAKGFKSDQCLKHHHMVVHRRSESTVGTSAATGGQPTANIQNSEASPPRPPPTIKFLSPSILSKNKVNKVTDPSRLPTPKRQVFLCSSCDVIFATTDELRAHFDEKHPHLIANRQVVLKSTRVPAAYLENKMSQQKLDASKFCTPASPAKILESLKRVNSPSRPTPTRMPGPVNSPPTSPNKSTNEQHKQSPMKMFAPGSPAKAKAPVSPVKVVVPGSSPVKKVAILSSPAKASGSPVKVPLTALTTEQTLTAAQMMKNEKLAQEAKQFEASQDSKPKEGGNEKISQEGDEKSKLENNSSPTKPTAARGRKATAKMMTAIAQVQMDSKAKNNVDTAKASEKDSMEEEAESKEKAASPSPSNKRVQKSPAPESKRNSESPKRQSHVPSINATTVSPKTKAGKEISPSPKSNANEKSEGVKSRAKSTSTILQTRVSTRQNKGQSSKNTDYEFYTNNAITDGEVDNTSTTATNSTLTSSETPAVKRKAGRPPKRQVPSFEEVPSSAESEPSPGPSPAKSRKVSVNVRAVSPDISSSSRASPAKSKSKTNTDKLNQTNGKGKSHSPTRVSTRGSTSRKK